MKRLVVVFGLLCCLMGSNYGQSIQYSKGSFKVDDPSQAQLVSNLQGYHHVITVTYNKKPVIHIFDDHLRLVEKKELDFPIKKDCELKIIPFTNYYYLVLRIFKPTFYEIWKIDKEGGSTRLTKDFMAVYDSIFNQQRPAVQLMDLNGQLYAYAQAYFDSLHSIRCKVVQLDEQFRVTKNTTFFYPFEKETDYLQQVSLIDNALVVLKSTRDYSSNSLTVMKLDLETGDILTTSYNTGPQASLNPGMILCPKDSSILVYSTLVQTDADRRVHRSILVSRLDQQLKEQTPVTLLKHQFNQNTATNFLMIQSQPSLWLNLTTTRRIQVLPSHVNPPVQSATGRSMPSIAYGFYNNNYYLGPTAVRFTVVDSQFRAKSDSLVANDKKIVEVQSSPFGQFNIGDRGYLVLVQNFTAKRKGLVVYSSDENGKLAETGLPVFDRYDYVLNQLQAFDNNFVVPYSYRNEMGLMKVTLKD